MLIIRNTLKYELPLFDVLIIDYMNKSDIIQSKSNIKIGSRSPLTS
jgi:hypothetical protein